MNQKRWGRIFALFSAICFCLSACLVQFSGGTASAAEEDAVYNGYSYQISQDGSAVITGCEKIGYTYRCRVKSVRIQFQKLQTMRFLAAKVFRRSWFRTV